MLFSTETQEIRRSGPPLARPQAATPRQAPLAISMQPRVDLRDGRLCAMQAALLPSLSRAGQPRAPALDALLDQALSWAAQAKSRGQAVPVAIELSAEHLHCDALPGRIELALQRHALPASLLEVTLAPAPVDDSLLAQAMRLRRLGLTLTLGPLDAALDAPAALQRLPISRLRLSSSLVAGLDSPRLAAWLQSLLLLSRQLGLRCIAEGITSPEQLALLRRLGCAEGLGFLLALPMSPTQALTLLQDSPPWQPLLAPHSRSLTL